MPKDVNNIVNPFDPTSIDVEKKNMSISSLITMLENNIIDLSPAFQRKPDLWDDKRQSQLIESIILKLPLPSMYFEYDTKQRKYVVIDGLQRLCTLKNFAVEKTLRLKGLEFLQDDYGDCRYDDLSFTDRLEIGLQEITVNILKGTTPDYAKFIIFKRLNSGATQLNNQEIRNALYGGQGTQLIANLAQCHDMESIGFKSQRLNDQEIVLRYLAFKTKGYDSYSGRMAEFLTDCLISLNDMDDYDIKYLALSFTSALRRNIDIFGNMAFRNPNKNKGRLPSSSLFDALMVGMSELTEERFSRLHDNRQLFVGKFTELLSRDKELIESIGSKSDRRASSFYRYNTLSDILKQYSR